MMTTSFPFIRDELTWIPTVLAAEKPYLGICLGGAATGQSPGGQSQASILRGFEKLVTIRYSLRQRGERCYPPP